tara:strand:+ start:713 stop:1234 length:522 start_codon:yes stop_codon:yes gene_type:complete
MKEDYEVSEISLEDTALIIQNTNDKEDIYGLDYPWAGGLRHYCYGLFNKDKLVGAVQFCSYHKNQQWHIPFHQQHYGCHTETCEGFYELARLGVLPQDEHNITGWFLSRAMKLLNPKVVVTVAEEEKGGTIYKATNFDYYGLMTDRDWYEPERPFHVYLKIFDKNIQCEWKKT